MTKNEFISAVKSVFDACRHLSETSGKMRNFRPDGKMVGDIGEVIAGTFYQVSLYDDGHHDWDGTYKGRNVQIKTTGGIDTYLNRQPEEGFADGLLMVFYIDRQTGEYNLIYNGDIQSVWDELNGATFISLNRLRDLQKSVRHEDRIPEA